MSRSVEASECEIDNLVTMRRHISKSEKEVALRMSLESGLSDIKIAEYTGIRPRTMRSLRKRFQETGEVVKKPVVSSRPRLLNSLDATVSYTICVIASLTVFYSS